MANRRKSMRRIPQVLRLAWEVGLKQRPIARSLTMSPATVGEYLRRARMAGLSWPLPSELNDTELEARLFPPPQSIAGCSDSPRRWRNACAGSGAGPGRQAGVSTRPTSRSAGQVGVSVPCARQVREHTRFLPLGDPQHQGREAVPRQGAEGWKEWELPEVVNTDKAPASV